jgi:hypothetical protein
LKREDFLLSSFTILILVCVTSLSHSECQPETALTVLRGPQVQNELMCGFLGQTTLAGGAVAPRPDREYAKIMCLRTTETAEKDPDAAGAPSAAKP